jgi:hypothetical protein
MMPNKPETLRELQPDEEPKKEEITWEIDRPITSGDQYRLAKAVEKRLRRAMKVRPNDDTQQMLFQVNKELKRWEER